MAIRIVPDKDQPSAAIEIPLEKPLPDYDLEELEQPTPRDVDGILVSQGFRDLVDDARGVITELLARSGDPHSRVSQLKVTDAGHHPLELTQLTGAICPDDDDSYRPGLWFVLRDTSGQRGHALLPGALDHIRGIANELVKRLRLD